MSILNPNPQSSVASTGDKVSYDNAETKMEADTVQEAIDELFTSVSDGKTLIASAITDMGVKTEPDATFEQMGQNIRNIKAIPGNVYKIALTADPEEGGTVSGGGYASEGMTCSAKAEANDGYVFYEWDEDGETVSKNPDYAFSVSIDRNLIAVFGIPTKFVWWSPHMTSNTTPAPFVASASSVYGSAYGAWNAFDGVPSDNYGAGGHWVSKEGGESNAYIQIDIGKKLLVNGFKANPGYANIPATLGTPNRLYIAGSNDGIKWTDISDYDNISWAKVNQYTEFMLDRSVSYRYYRFGCMDVTTDDTFDGRVSFGDIQFYIPENEALFANYKSQKR